MCHSLGFNDSAINNVVSDVHNLSDMLNLNELSIGENDLNVSGNKGSENHVSEINGGSKRKRTMENYCENEGSKINDLLESDEEFIPKKTG